MKASLSPFIRSQSFNSEVIETVWVFDDNQQFICGIKKNGSVYMEAGKINAAGDYEDEAVWGEASPNQPLDDMGIWSTRKFPEVYKNFTYGKDLIPLINDVVEYLK